MIAAFLAVAEAQAKAVTAMHLATAAMLRCPTVTIRDIHATTYWPFGQGFSQDIDPVTTWLLPFSFGVLPGTQKAAALVTEIRGQQALVDRLVAGCDGYDDSQAVTRARGADSQPAMPLDRGEIEALRRTKENLERLIGPAQGPDPRRRET
ncbi:MAG: hypothetical protein AAFT19_09495 [Pseudomonadota bacterium]